MKLIKQKTPLLIAACCLVMFSCNTPAEKVEDAKDHVIEANQDLNKANDEYLKDIENYRLETAKKIDENNESIKTFKERIEKQKKDARKDYQEKIDMLEAKNSDMKMKLDNYKSQNKENWESFKAEFSHDMEELGKAFNDFTITNNKK